MGLGIACLCDDIWLINTPSFSIVRWVYVSGLQLWGYIMTVIIAHGLSHDLRAYSHLYKLSLFDHTAS